MAFALFERVGKGLSLTPSGLELMEHVRAMGEAATRVSLTASGRSQTVEGTVRVTATEVASAFTLPAIVARIRKAHAGIAIEIVSSNDLRDLRRREADIAIRSVRPSDPDLFARKIGVRRAYLYASKSYLKKLGALARKQDLSRADYIGFDENEQLLDALNRRGLDLSARNFPVLCGSHLVQWELVKRGLGIGIMTEDVGEAEPTVERAAPWFAAFEFEVWLVAHRELNTSRRVRIVFDILAEELSTV